MIHQRRVIQNLELDTQNEINRLTNKILRSVDKKQLLVF